MKICKVVIIIFIMLVYSMSFSVVMAADNWEDGEYAKYEGWRGDGSGRPADVSTWNSNIQDLIGVGMQSKEIMNTRYTNALLKALGGGKLVTENEQEKKLTKQTLPDYKKALENMNKLIDALENDIDVDKLSRANKQSREKGLEEYKEYVKELSDNISEKEKEINDANTDTETGGSNTDKSDDWKTADVSIWDDRGYGKTFLEFQKEANKLLNVDVNSLSDEDLDTYFNLLMTAKRNADQITTQDESEETELEKLRQKLIDKIENLPSDRLTDEQKNYANNVKNAGRGADDSDYYRNDKIYYYPTVTVGDVGDDLDSAISNADDFVNNGNVDSVYDANDLQRFSSSMYNILLTVGIVVAVIVGAVIGIKLMSSGIETKVEAKKLLIPYVAGCIVVFGGFAIWKIVVTILQQV